MTAKQLFSNNSESTLASGISAGATSLTIQTGDGDKSGRAFPNPSGGDWFMATLDDGTNIEVIKVTARSTDTFTSITRAQEGTSAAAFSANTTKVEVRSTAGTFANWVQMDSNKKSTQEDGTGKQATIAPGARTVTVIADTAAIDTWTHTTGATFTFGLTGGYAKFLTTSNHSFRLGANGADLLEMKNDGSVNVVGTQGLGIASGTPSSTANKIWQLNGVSYWGDQPLAGFANLGDFFRMR